MARRMSTVAALLLTASVALAACGPKQSGGGTDPVKPPVADTGSKAEKKPKVAGELNLRLAKDADNFNPILSTTSYGGAIIAQVFSGLFEFDEKFEPKGDLAESWKASDDGLSWTIKVKQGVKFHDGLELTADDVVFTIESVMDPEYTGAAASAVTEIKSIKAADKYTVAVELKQPFAPLLENLNFPIMARKHFEGTKVADFEKHERTFSPIGTGPYKLVQYERGQFVLLERNENWHRSAEFGGAPFIQKLRYKVIPDGQTGLLALQGGEIDVENPEPEAVSQLLEQYKDKLTAYDYERNGWGYMTFNTSKAPLDDKRVRQALTHALDRQSIIDGAMDGRAVIPAGPLPSVSWAYDPNLKPLEYNQQKAKALLEEAGFKLNKDGIYEKDGKPLKLTFYGSSGSSLIEALALIAKQNWKAIGVELDTQIIDFQAMLDNFVSPGKFDVSFSGFSLGLDPDTLYTVFHSSQAKPDANGNVNGFNRMRYVNPEFDRLLEEGRRVSDQAQRKAIYAKAQQILTDDAPVILVYSNRYTDFASKRIQGGVVNYPGAGVNPAGGGAGFMYRWYLDQQ